MEDQKPENNNQPEAVIENQANDRPWFKKKRFIIPLGLVLLVGVVNALGEDEEPASNTEVVQEQSSEDQTVEGDESDTATDDEETAAAEDSPAGEDSSAESDSDSSGTSNEEATEPDSESRDDSTSESSVTTSQANAIDSAESYLRFSAFSKTGLTDQLEFEGFSNADATFAVNNVTVDWFEQAAESAKSYLDYSSFSRQGLIDQLEFEGFTSEQAVYGVDAVGLSDSSSGGSSGESVSQANAVESAESYLRFSSFSRTGLIEQLEFEGYSNADAVYAVDKVNPDWNEQAAKSAQSYLDYSSFSRQGLIDQLKFEGFTTQEATYGVNAVGL